MTGAMRPPATATPTGRESGVGMLGAGSWDGSPARVFKRVSVLRENSPVWVSEGGLEPPCPFGALAPQASASAYSATRTYAGAQRCRAGRLTIANPGRSRRSELICPAKPAPYTTGQRHAARAGAGVPAEAPVAQREMRPWAGDAEPSHGGPHRAR